MPTHDSRDFFDRQSSEKRYAELKAKLHVQDEIGARILNDEVSGEALVVGGVWDSFEWRSALQALTVLDSSRGMLKDYAPKGSIPVLGDLFVHEFAPESFDTVVFPLMLHHTAERSWRRSQRRIAEALQRAKRWLRPSGRLLILEHCPHPAWNPLQRVALPATKLFMKSIGQPLVLLQTKDFFERQLTTIFGACNATRLESNGLKPWTMLPVFLAAPWVQLPFAVYPKAYVFSAIKS
jgi:SAM-dependent methyltransferase